MPVVVGGIIPPDDADALKEAGVAAVYTPKDFELNRIMTDLLRVVETAAEQKDKVPSAATAEPPFGMILSAKFAVFEIMQCPPPWQVGTYCRRRAGSPL